MLTDTILALGLLLTASSQLRPDGVPLGPGELCLVAWIALVVTRAVRGDRPTATFALSGLLAFWMVFVFAECLGTLFGLATRERYDAGLFLHDVMAYPLIAAVSCLSVAASAARTRLHRVAWLMATIGTLSLGLQAANGFGLLSVPGLQPWFWERFRGWSSNPNQLALLCVVLTFIPLHLADTAQRGGPRFVAMCCAIAPITVGVLTRSDTFTLALFAGGAIYAVLKIALWLRSPDPRFALRSAIACMVVIALPLLAISALPFAYTMATDARQAALDMSKGGAAEATQEADLRLSLWQQAFQRGVESAMLGLGPGPHLDIPASIVAGRSSTTQPDNIVHPTQNGAPNFEAHNTLFDLFTQGGLLAVLAFLSLVAVAFGRALRAGAAGLATLLAAVVLFGMTGLIVRQPVFWFAVALCLVAEPQVVRGIARRAQTNAALARGPLIAP
ncbi:MAG: O-antigen ligase family protein [Devosia sp.]|nr:O-antigen ligase family protein [Devosia sp.]